jgi:hypothetical protein
MVIRDNGYGYNDLGVGKGRQVWEGSFLDPVVTSISKLLLESWEDDQK